MADTGRTGQQGCTEKSEAPEQIATSQTRDLSQPSAPPQAATVARKGKKNPGMSVVMKETWARRRAEAAELERLRAENAELRENRQDRCRQDICAAARPEQKKKKKEVASGSGAEPHIAVPRQLLPPRREHVDSAAKLDAESDDDETHHFVQKKAKKVDKTVQQLQQVEQRLHSLHLQQAARVNPYLQLLSQR